MQLGELQFGEIPHFFNMPHAFKKIGEMQFGEMPHTLMFHYFILFIYQNNLSHPYINGFLKYHVI